MHDLRHPSSVHILCRMLTHENLLRDAESLLSCDRNCRNGEGLMIWTFDLPVEATRPWANSAATTVITCIAIWQYPQLS